MSLKIPRQKILIIAMSVILLIAGVVWLIEHSQKSSPDYTQTIVDRDTGEKASFQPNKSVESNAGGENVVIFGSTALINNGATEAQYMIVRDLLNQYSRQSLKSAFETVTIIPSSVKADSGDIKSQLRLGQSNTKLDLEVKLSNLYDVQVLVSDPTGKYPNFDSGVHHAPKN